MTGKKEITIYDIAKVLGLSPATVSRGLKDHPAINFKTRKRITEAAKEMGYRSNSFASNLRMQKTHTIGIVVHELKSQFISSVLAGIEKVTTDAGYHLLIAHSSETYRKEVANVHNLYHQRVDGLIASLAYDTTDMSHYDTFVKKGIPIVFFDRVDDFPYGTHVVIDNVKAGYEATAHLAAQGCRNIAHITASLNRNVYAGRLKGYKQALTDYGLHYEAERLFVNDLSEAAAVRTAKQFLQMSPRPDGVFITNDFFAAVFQQTLREGGMRIPEDIAIVSFNNDAISRTVQPKLSTINYPGEEVGEKAAQSLIHQLQSKTPAPAMDTIIIRSELIIRDSSLHRKI